MCTIREHDHVQSRESTYKHTCANLPECTSFLITFTTDKPRFVSLELLLRI